MTAWELVSLDAVLKPKFQSFGKVASSRRHHGELYFDWLSKVSAFPVTAFPLFDEKFVDLLSSCLLVGEPERRKSLAQSLDHPYLVDEPLMMGKTCSTPLTRSD